MTSTSNRISATLTPTEADKIRKAIEAVDKLMPFLVSLDDAARKELHPVGDMSREFIRKGLVAAKTHPEALPRSFDIPEFEKDVELSEAIYPLLLAVRRVHNRVESTHALALSEAYASALVVYRSVRDNDVDGAMAAARGELASRFSRKPRKKPQPSSKQPQPSTPEPTRPA
jgi:hypothetical protein